MMFNSRNLGALIVDEDPHVKSWEDGQYNIMNMSIEETYGFGILNEGQAIAVAKNVKIRPNEFVMPARSVFTFLLRMNINGLVIDTICQRADLYEGSLARRPADDVDEVGHGRGHGDLQKRGYISKANITSHHASQQNSGGAAHTRSLLPVAQQAPRARARPRPEPTSDVETMSNHPGDRPGMS